MLFTERLLFLLQRLFLYRLIYLDGLNLKEEAFKTFKHSECECWSGGGHQQWTDQSIYNPCQVQCEQQGLSWAATKHMQAFTGSHLAQTSY